MEQIEELLVKVQQHVIADARIKREKYKRGENFNIFNTLGLQSDEVRLHSAFIAELLNPCGSHGMGAEFLSAFLKTVGLPVDYIVPSNVAVNNMVERAIGAKTADTGGRIDIIMEDGGHAVIIENKIYAADQENQLLRYFNYAKGKFGSDNFSLLYLTLDGHEPSKESLGNTSEVKYKCISYANDILKWLDACAKLAFNKPLIRETINQYINLLKQLTGKDMDKQQQSEMFAAMAKYPEAVASIFHNGFHSFRDYLLKANVFPKFQKMANDYGLIFSEENLLSGDKEIFYSFHKPQWKHLKIYINSEERGKNFYIGIAFVSPEMLIKEYPQVQLDCMSDKPNDWWPYGTQYLGKYTSIEDSAILPALLDTSKNGYCAYIMSKVNNVLEELKQKGIEIV